MVSTRSVRSHRRPRRRPGRILGSGPIWTGVQMVVCPRSAPDQPSPRRRTGTDAPSCDPGRTTVSETTTDTTTPGDGTDAPAAVATPEELTPEWLTATLAAAGRPIEVTAVSHTAIGTGQMGSSYRLTLE